MPKVTQTQQKPKIVVPSGSLLSRAIPLDQHAGDGIHMGLYGRTKTGKSRLMATFPKPSLFLMTDDEGEASIKGILGIEIIQIVLSRKKYDGKNCIEVDEIRPLIGELPNSKFASVFLDTATTLQEIMLAKICGLDELALTKKADMMPKNRKEEYMERAEQMKFIISDLLKLKDKHVVISSHERDHSRKEKEDESPQTYYGDLITPAIGPGMSKTAAEYLCANASYIGHTFIREKTETKESNAVAGKSITIQRKVGGMEYCLRIGPDPIFMTGFRLVPGAKLPDVIVNPTFDKIMDVIQGKPVRS